MDLTRRLSTLNSGDSVCRHPRVPAQKNDSRFLPENEGGGQKRQRESERPTKPNSDTQGKGGLHPDPKRTASNQASKRERESEHTACSSENSGMFCLGRRTLPHLRTAQPGTPLLYAAEPITRESGMRVRKAPYP